MLTLGFALLVAPRLMQSIWPWRTGIMMLQLYSMPLLAYGMGSLLLTRNRGWLEARNALIAHAVFFCAEFLASLRFVDGLDGAAISVLLWFLWLGISSLFLLVLSIVAVHTTLFRPTAPPQTILKPLSEGAST